MAAVDIFSALEHLAATSRPVVDHPRGTPHPRYGEVIYPLDYGYLDVAGRDVVDGSRRG